MLKIEGLNVNYGAIHALHDISIHVKVGEIVTLIGANGAGKTSILRAISGLIPIKSGSVLFEGKPIHTTPAYKLSKLGIAHVPEGRRIFANMSVMENLELGAYIRKDKSDIAKDYEMVFDKFPRLKERIKQMAGKIGRAHV